MRLSRRTVLSTAAAGIVTAAAANGANGQTPDVPQPMRPGRGGTDPGPRNVPLEQQNPDIYVPPATDHGTVPTSNFHSRNRTCGSSAAVGHAR